MRKFLFMCVCFAPFFQEIDAQGNWFTNERVVASKKTVTTDVKLRPFHSISIIGSGDIDFTASPVGTAPKATLIMPENLQDIVQVFVKDEVLYFQFKKGYNVSINNTTLKLQLAAPMVESLKITGSGDVDFLNDIQTDRDVDIAIVGSGDVDVHSLACGNLNVTISGSGDVDLGTTDTKQLYLKISGSGDIEAKNVKSRELTVSIAGSGDVDLRGEADTASYSIAGSGDLKAHALKARTVKATVAGSGDLTCYATESLTAYTTGVGDIRYKGDPKTLNISKKGVRKM